MLRCTQVVIPFFLACCICSAQEGLDDTLWGKALHLKETLFVIDVHSHDLFKPLSPKWSKQVSGELMETGGLDGLVQNLPLEQGRWEHPSEMIHRDVREVRRKLEVDDTIFELARNASDFRRIHSRGKRPVMLGLEYFRGLLEGRVKTLGAYHAEGVRMIGLFSGGLDLILEEDEQQQQLTRFGLDVIERMNQLGIAIDVTHLRDPVRLQVIRASRAPVVASHANAQGIVPSGFNLGDETIDQLAGKGGLVGLTFFSESVSPSCYDKRGEQEDLALKPRARVEELIDHLDYLKERIGIKSIAVGSDFGGAGRLSPKGLETAAGFPLIIYHMLERGYSEEEIAMVMGRNFLAFVERVEAVSAR